MGLALSLFNKIRAMNLRNKFEVLQKRFGIFLNHRLSYSNKIN